MTVATQPRQEIVLTDEQRRASDLREGQRFVVVPVGNELHLVEVQGIDSIYGLLRGADPTGYRERPAFHGGVRTLGSMSGTARIVGNIVAPLDEPWEAVE